jgi:low temperature requirement protein LtrA
VSEASRPSEERDEPDKRVDWAELFFDLVFVFAVTQVSLLLESDHSWGGLLRAIVVFVPLYWMWVGTAIQTNLRDITQPALRIKVFGIGLTSILMAVVLPHAYGADGWVFALGYWAGRLVMGSGTIVDLLRGHLPGFEPYTTAMFVSGPLLVVGSLTHGDTRLSIWAVAALLDLASPTLFRRRLSRMRLNPAHLSERFGLFLLIALGESVVEIGTSAQSDQALDAARGFAVAAAFVFCCALWWVYFQFAADAVRHALATAKVQLDITRMVLSYGHLLFIAGIIVATVGLREAVAEPTSQLSWSTLGLLHGGTALYLATFGATRWTMFHLVSKTRLTAAAAVLVAFPLGGVVPALGDLVILAGILVVLNLVELTIVFRRSHEAAMASPGRGNPGSASGPGSSR